jgi:tetratricopeptide (TPR) repeat protein
MGMSEETANCTICRQPLAENGRCPHCDEEGHVWTIQDWRPLLTLSMMIVLGFSFTRLVVSAFNEVQNTLGAKYYTEGVHALEVNHPGEAVDAFETALLYCRDSIGYRLKLTDALVASGANGEALAQLHSFWEQRPGDAEVNLKLARLEGQRRHVDAAVRYYENAIDGMWPEHSDPVPQRIAVRFESAEYLMREGRPEQAEAALLALAAVLPTYSPEQARLAELYLRNGDPARALSIYQAQLSVDKKNNAAIYGAAQASFAAGSYATALRYLEELKPETAESQELRLKLERMEALDPFARSATGKVRTARTMAVFRIAIERLAGCGVPFAEALSNSAPTASAKDPEQWNGFAKWAEQLSPMMSERKLRGRDDLIESTMRFAFQSETAAQKNCGNLTLDDEALLLLARERMGASQ